MRDESIILLIILKYLYVFILYNLFLSILVHVVGNKVFLLDDSENNEQLELDSVITLDYNQINPDSPSSNSEQPMRIASIQFNTVNFIGMLKFSPCP